MCVGNLTELSLGVAVTGVSIEVHKGPVEPEKKFCL
jgi:hypothetical protein